MQPPNQDQYTREEIAEILQRALQRQQPTQGMSREELKEAAREVGISPGDLEIAEEEVRERREIRREALERQRKARKRFGRSVLFYALVNAFLFLIDMMTVGGPWFYWVLIIWGFFLLLQGLGTLSLKEEPVERRRARLAREARRRRRRESAEAFKRDAHELGEAVREGLSVLMRSATEEIRERTREQPSTPQLPPPSARHRIELEALRQEEEERQHSRQEVEVTTPSVRR